MVRSYFEEFDKRYNRPAMDNVTVGCSGIDPSPNVDSIVQEQLKIRTASREEIDAMLDEVWG